MATLLSVRFVLSAGGADARLRTMQTHEPRWRWRWRCREYVTPRSALATAPNILRRAMLCRTGFRRSLPTRCLPPAARWDAARAPTRSARPFDFAVRHVVAQCHARP